MRINDALLESLLHEEEGVHLDLKSEQYRFSKASDDEKSELLKDILAFANAWRHADSFILVGVKEIKGGRNEVLGITDLLDDAAIQQFVNTKTQRPITFSYRNCALEGKHIGIFHVPIQQRPFYLQKDFGKLRKETVYVRRGSSTDIATLDEIARMGSHALNVTTGAPELSIAFGDPRKRECFSTSIHIRSLHLKTPGKKDIPDYVRDRGGGVYAFTPLDLLVNSSYYRELVEYTRMARLMAPVFLAVKNAGTSTARDVRAELKFPKDESGPILKDAATFPDVPSTESDYLRPRNFVAQMRELSPDVHVRRYDGYWLVAAHAEKVQAKSTHWFSVPFYLGSKMTATFNAEVTIHCDDLSEPVTQGLSVSVDAESRDVDLEGILDLERERFRNSPQFKRFLAARRGEEEQE